MCDGDKPKIYGRKCSVKEIPYHEARCFLNENHIQGSSKSSVYLGAYFKETIIGVMTFNRYKNNKWELTRFATINNHLCIGVASKMFKYFVDEWDPVEIKSFADRRWTIDSENNLYTKLGFTLEKVERPDYMYIFNGECKRHHKFGFRKTTLNKKHGLSMDMTESEMAKKIGVYKIYNCGLFKYVWRKKSD